jgi:hypothetical protein
LIGDLSQEDKDHQQQSDQDCDDDMQDKYLKPWLLAKDDCQRAQRAVAFVQAEPSALAEIEGVRRAGGREAGGGCAPLQV